MGDELDLDDNGGTIDLVDSTLDNNEDLYRHQTINQPPKKREGYVWINDEDVAVKDFPASDEELQPYQNVDHPPNKGEDYVWIDDAEKKDEVMDDKTRLSKIFDSLPTHKQTELMGFVEQFAEKAAFQPPPLPEVCPPEKSYDNWKSANKSKDGKECLKQGWGQWLKAFNTALDHDYMSQADLGRLDQKLLARLKQQYKAEILNQIIPSLPIFNSQMVDAVRLEGKKEIYKKANIAARYL